MTRYYPSDYTQHFLCAECEAYVPRLSPTWWAQITRYAGSYEQIGVCSPECKAALEHRGGRRTYEWSRHA